MGFSFGGTGGGGSGFALGPAPNSFGSPATADMAAARVLLDAQASGDAAWLALYNGDRSFYARLVWTGNATAFLRRNAAGTDWENVTGLVAGVPGLAGTPGTPGGGAIEPTGIVLDLRTVSIPDEEFIATGLMLGARGTTPILLFRVEADKLGLLWMDTDPLYDLTTASAGDASDLTGADRNALQMPEMAGTSVSGNVLGGITDAGELLIAFDQDDPDTYVEFWKYVPAEAQGGLTAAERAELARLSGVETGATADQTGAEIKTAYEAQGDTNAFTDAEKTKLGGVEASATADQTGAEIKTAYEAQGDTNAFTNALLAKLNAIEAGATADLSGAEIVALINAAIGSMAWQQGGTGGSDTAAQVLAKLLTVDGSGSGLDADLLDGMTPAQVAALGGGSFDLHDDVTTELTSLAAQDRFLVADENTAGDPNRYVTLTRLQNALVSAAYLTVTRNLTTVARANELIQAALAAAVTGNTETGITVTHNSDGTIDFVVTGGGGTPVVADDVYFGLSADDTPEGSELTIAAANGVGTIPAFVDMFMLIARLATEGDITSVVFSDDLSQTNQIGAFAKHADTVVPPGETEMFAVWVSNQLLTQPAEAQATVG